MKRDEVAVADIERGLRELLTEVLAQVAAGADPDELPGGGSELSPGVWHNGEEWEAWEWDPRDPEGAEVIVVTQSELAKQ